jgi:hypothetical protein
VTPSPARLLELLTQNLLTEIMPAVAPAYRQASVATWGILVQILGEELERAAARRFEENGALRALFGEALATVADAGLASQLRAAAAGADTSLRISDLDAANRELRALLIALHAHVEGLDGEAARALDDAIWRELAASTERRRIAIAPF